MTGQRVCVIGLGYVGLPTAAIIAQAGHIVEGVDIRPSVIDSLRNGFSHVHEPGLAELLGTVIDSGHFRCSHQPGPADVFIIAVPTPIDAAKRIDLAPLAAGIRSITPHLASESLLLIESTLPPGCVQTFILPMLAAAGLDQVDLAYCPERVLTGSALLEITNNPRIVGGRTPRAAERARQFYRTFTNGPVQVTGVAEAELVKLAENAFRDVNIAFANELANVCEHLDVNVQEVIRLANLHPRVSILKPGPGVGGQCIGVDPWFLIQRCPQDTPLLRASRSVNDRRPERIRDQALRLLGRAHLDRPVVGVFGVTYKANVCDVRESPALAVIRLLQEKGLEVRVCDPLANGSCPFACLAAEDTVRGADLAILLVAHDGFRDLRPDALAALMRTPLLLDTQGLWEEMAGHTPVTHCCG